MNNKISKIIQIIVLIGVILAAGYYLIKHPNNKEKSDPTTQLDRIIDFKVMRDDLTEEQINRYRDEFEANVAEVLVAENNFDFTRLNQMAMTKRILHDFDGAKEIFEYINQGRPDNSLAYFNLGVLYMEDLKDNVKAEESFNKALENSKGESGNEQYYRAIASFYRYYYPENIRKTEKILLDALGEDKYKDNIDIMALLADYYQVVGEKEKALEYWQKILKINPDNQGVKNEIGRLENKQ